MQAIIDAIKSFLGSADLEGIIAKITEFVQQLFGMLPIGK